MSPIVKPGREGAACRNCGDPHRSLGWQDFLLEMRCALLNEYLVPALLLIRQDLLFFSIFLGAISALKNFIAIHAGFWVACLLLRCVSLRVGEMATILYCVFCIDV